MEIGASRSTKILHGLARMSRASLVLTFIVDPSSALERTRFARYGHSSSTCKRPQPLDQRHRVSQKSLPLYTQTRIETFDHDSVVYACIETM